VPRLGATLPVTPASTARDLAALALPFARLPLFVHGGAPPGFHRGIGWRPLLAAVDPPAATFADFSGFGAAIFIPCSGAGVVVVFDSTTLHDPRDLVAGTLRQVFGGWAPFSLRFLDAVVTAYPGVPILVVGHSSGGALASYAAGQRGLPSIAFNPSRTIAATTNPGTNQLVVIVEGDLIADPNVISFRVFRPPRQLSGATLWLDVEVPRPLLDLHDIETVITGLEALL
jgi:pimeloyl-ACP methyl ester carboxylesterase